MKIINSTCKDCTFKGLDAWSCDILPTSGEYPQFHIQAHEAQKSTCLWLHDLPLLQATNIVDKGEICTLSSGKRIPKWYSNCSNRTIKRAKTFSGIAQAMADQ